MLDPPFEPSIDADNQPDLTISTGVAQAPQALKTPAMKELVVDMDFYNTGANRNPQIVSNTAIYGTTTVTSSSEIIAVDICISPTPPSGCIWNGSIINLQKNTTPSLSNYSELNAPIDRRSTNDSISPSIISQILRD